jgi:SAM-dependent methyltransferase
MNGAIAAGQRKAPPRRIEILTRCPVCGSQEIAVAFPPTVWRCRCGLVFQNPRPHADLIAAHYEQGATFAAWEREETVRARLWRKRLRVVRRQRDAGRLLDVGTGDGHFLAVAGEVFDALGAEPSLAGCRRAAGRGVRVQHGTLADLDLPAGAFDVVTLWHVLEHLPYPVTELERVRHLLAPHGHLIVAVPNERGRLLRHTLLGRPGMPFPPLGPDDEIHLVHFTPATLRATLSAAGFTVLALGIDDVDTRRTPASRATAWAATLLSLVTGSPWGRAMLAVARVAPLRAGAEADRAGS